MIELLYIAFIFLFIVALLRFFNLNEIFKIKLKNVWLDYEKTDDSHKINNLKMNEELFFEKFKNDKIFRDRLKLFFSENSTYINKDVVAGVAKELIENGNFEKCNKLIENKKQGLWITYYSNGSHDEIADKINNKIKDYDNLEGFWENNFKSSNFQSKLVTNVKESKGNYINDKRDGLWEYYYKNGQIKCEVYWENDVEISRKKFEDNNELGWVSNLFYESGEIQRQYKFIDERTQLSRSFHKNGNIELTWKYLDSIQFGEETEFDENGNIQAKRNYNQGKQNGEAIAYFENGNIELIANYVDGKPHGKATEFYNSNSNNKIKVVKNFKNGELNGELTEFNENDKCIRKSRYIDGELEGEQIDYYENGQIREKGFFVNGLQHGQTLIYTEFGMLAKEQTYDRGELIEEKDNITKLKLFIDYGTRSLNDKVEEENTKGILDEFLFQISFILGLANNIENKNTTNDSKEEDSEYLKQHNELKNSLFIEIENFNKNDHKTKYIISKPIDINYYFLNICARAWHYIGQLDLDPNNKFEWQEVNFKQYTNTYAKDLLLGEEHIIKTLEHPLICFIHIYNKLQEFLDKINKLDSDFNISRNIHYYKEYELLLAHTHASVYAFFSILLIRCKSYSEEQFKKIFKDFDLNESHYKRLLGNMIEEIATSNNSI